MNLEKDVVWKQEDGYYSFEKYVKSYNKKDKNEPEEEKETVITIPSEYKGLPVKIIGDAAFSMNGIIEKVIIPDSIEKIGTMAFNKCEKLNIDGLSKNLKRVGYFAFNGTKAIKTPAFKKGGAFIIDDWFLSADDVEELTIPNYIKGVADYAFYFCGKLKKIILSESVKYIGMKAFAFGLDLDEVYIPAGAETDQQIFGSNVTIKKLTIPQEIYEKQQLNSTVKIEEVKLI